MSPDAFRDFRARIDGVVEVPLARSSSPAAVARIEGHGVPLFDVPQRVPGEPVFIGDNGQSGNLAARAKGGLRFGFDFWTSLGWFLSDSRSRASPAGIADASVPLVDLLEGTVLKSLADEFGPLQSPWPRGAPFALGLSHDVDRIRKTFQYVTHPLREMRHGNLRRAISLAFPRGSDAYWCFDQIERLEKRHGVASSFFFLHEAPSQPPRSLRHRIELSGVTRLDNEAVAGVARHLSDSGWEIGVHSSSFARNDAQRLRREKEMLDRIVGRPTAGVRQHFLTPEVAALWPQQREVGFRYDTTMGFSNRLGFRAGTSFPYPVDEPEGLYELPFEVMDGALSGVRDPWAACKGVMDSVESVGGAFVLLWHQRFFNEHEFPGYADLYDRLIHECRRRNAWIATLGEIVERWRRVPS